MLDAAIGPSGAGQSSPDLLRRLTGRELQVLGMTTDGSTNNEIARRLDVSTSAVKFHLASIYRKLGVSNRTEAAVYFLRANAPDEGAATPASRDGSWI